MHSKSRRLFVSSLLVAFAAVFTSSLPGPAPCGRGIRRISPGCHRGLLRRQSAGKSMLGDHGLYVWLFVEPHAPEPI